MQVMTLFMGIIPLIAFVIVDCFAGLKSALVTAILFAALELCFSLYLLGSVDWLTGISVGLVLILSFFAWKYKSSIHFKMQPVVLSAILGVLTLISYWAGYPLLVLFFDKYAAEFPVEMQVNLNHPYTRNLLETCSHYLGYAFVMHAFVTGWCAIKLSNWWWLVARGIGFYIFQVGAFVAAKISVGG